MQYYHTTQSSGRLIENRVRHSIVVASIEDAEDFFVYAKNDLLSVNKWKQYCPSLTVSFELTNNNGYVLHRRAHSGDNIRLATEAGNHKLHIDSIVYDDYPDADTESISMLIGGDAHFSMAIERSGNHLSAEYNGEDELPGFTRDQLNKLVTSFITFDEQ
ncbi:MAG: hypothetical protein JSS82_11970 [Bacteroidetes bacterium]|nr:hypothetical protein [Bacteroidota bacterium]